jgi:hypothetical protein
VSIVRYLTLLCRIDGIGVIKATMYETVTEIERGRGIETKKEIGPIGIGTRTETRTASGMRGVRSFKS